MCFSIHKRIEGGATRDAFIVSDGLRCFSIHKRIEGGATQPEPLLGGIVDEFQYPQADRRGCNVWSYRFWWAERSRFSIHKRIEGGATGGRPHQTPPRLGFQYPQADRRGCNRASIYNRLTILLVSVSTSGSKGVQLPPAKCRPQHDCVSVSTSGSKGVQRTPMFGTHIASQSFSIHKRIEGGATDTLRPLPVVYS